MKKNLKYKAFTLAETLVTLAILGVVSALTVPALKNHADEQKYVNFTKKALQDVTNATAKLEAIHGDVIFWETSKIVDYYGKTFDKVPTTRSLTWKMNPISTGTGGSDIAFNWFTNDGFAWRVESLPNNWVGITVDVNGDLPPNISGVDQHIFIVRQDGVLPSNDCTKYVIKHGKMPWLRTPMASCPTE